MKEIIKQWNLPPGAKVKLYDGSFITFEKMDGMYAHWDNDGKLGIGNFDGFIQEGEYYKPLIN